MNPVATQAAIQKGEPRAPWRGAALGLALLGAAIVPPDASLAQDVDCQSLRASIRALDSDNGQRDTRAIDRAADQQRREIERTRRYAAQIGCGRQGGLFSDGPPPECGDIEDRLGRMQDNLDRIQEQAGAGSPIDNLGRRAALVARYVAACSIPGVNLLPGGTAGLSPEEGRNPADVTPPDDLSTVPLNGSIMQDGSDQPRNAGKTICVRTCDGGYFPLAPHASSEALDGLEQLCKASCPNTEARLYTMRGEDLAGATAIDGSSYTDLPAAFKFEKSFTATCTCKPPNQSWADALAGAEKLLDAGDERDVTVTAALSDQMARPVAAPAPAAKKGSRRQPAPPAAGLPDGKVAADAQRGAQAPTASNASSGIGGAPRPARVLGPNDGLRITTEDPNGTKKQIRLIVP